MSTSHSSSMMKYGLLICIYVLVLFYLYLNSNFLVQYQFILLKRLPLRSQNHLNYFFRTLYCDLLVETNLIPKENTERRVMSSVSDAVFMALRGRVRPWENTCLGLGMGTLTGSKIVLQMLNRFGHSLSYDEVEALETEFALTVSDDNQETPDELLHKSILATAWDNYDVNIEMLGG